MTSGWWEREGKLTGLYALPDWHFKVPLLETGLGQVNGWSDPPSFCICSYFFRARMLKVWLTDAMQPWAEIVKIAVYLSFLYPRHYVLCHLLSWHRWNIRPSYSFWQPGWLAQKTKMTAALLLSPVQHFSSLAAALSVHTTHRQDCLDLWATTCRSAWPRKAVRKWGLQLFTLGSLSGAPEGLWQ